LVDRKSGEKGRDEDKRQTLVNCEHSLGSTKVIQLPSTLQVTHEKVFVVKLAMLKKNKHLKEVWGRGGYGNWVRMKDWRELKDLIEGLSDAVFVKLV
jgi:hypothetical protein